jgi:ELWxxDGT repeat protein
LYFAASNYSTGTELYSYDGVSSPAVWDINPGPPNSNPSGMTVFHDILFFAASGQAYGAQLWDVDNPDTSRGLWGIINPSGNASPANLIVYNDALYFSANDGVNGVELWKEDGTNAPVRVTQIAPGSANSSPANLAVCNGALYFSATDGTSGVELWKYDGTNATRVADINPGSASSSPAGLTVYNGALSFAATTVTNGRQLWKYDGTTVSLAAVLNPGTGSSSFGPTATFQGAYYLTAIGTNTVFYKYDGANFTAVSSTIVPETTDGLVPFNNALYFSSPGGSPSDQIWKYDGTNFTSLGYVFPGNFGGMKLFNGALYFAGNESTHGTELWKCDGTNIARVSDINPGAGNAYPLDLTVFNNALYFMASDGTTEGLWKFDGTNASRAGTMILNNINGLLVYNGALLMGAASSGSDFEPWKYDGTNFTFIAEINAFSTNASPIFWTTCRNAAYFSANDGIHPTGLFSYDGTNVSRITSFAGITGIYQFAFNNTLYFMANDGLTGYELWKYDGTNVSQVADINPGFNGSQPEPLSAYNGSYFFQANDGLHGNQLWRLDPLSQVLRFTSITRQGNDVALAWQTPGGFTNIVQSAGGMGGTNRFTDHSPPILTSGSGILATNYLDIGGATNSSARFYRLRLGP